MANVDEEQKKLDKEQKKADKADKKAKKKENKHHWSEEYKEWVKQSWGYKTLFFLTLGIDIVWIVIFILAILAGFSVIDPMSHIVGIVFAVFTVAAGTLLGIDLASRAKNWGLFFRAWCKKIWYEKGKEWEKNDKAFDMSIWEAHKKTKEIKNNGQGVFAKYEAKDGEAEDKPAKKPEVEDFDDIDY